VFSKKNGYSKKSLICYVYKGESGQMKRPYGLRLTRATCSEDAFARYSYSDTDSQSERELEDRRSPSRMDRTAPTQGTSGSNSKPLTRMDFWWELTLSKTCSHNKEEKFKWWKDVRMSGKGPAEMYDIISWLSCLYLTRVCEIG
jgi:hypothetical protein